MNAALIATFLLLVGLETVLGIDNILLISIVTGRLPAAQARKARLVGLALALAIRCLMLLGASWLVKLSEPVLLGLSWKSIVLLLGGGFLLVKAIKEIHHVVEAEEGEEAQAADAQSFAGAISQIVLLDIVFSIDSVITAVGLTDSLAVIYSAVIASFLLVLAFAAPIADFIHKHATLKILALSFLVTIGITLIIEGMGGHVPKGYIYLPMAFALAVEFLQMRFLANSGKKRRKKTETIAP